MKRYPELFLAILLVAPSWVHGQSKESSLFNGKDLSNWNSAPPQLADHWTTEDGIIIGDNPNKKGSVLWTNDDHGDYELALEFQTDSPDYDSGIFLRGFSHQVQIGVSRSLKKDLTACIYAPSDKKGKYPAVSDKVAAIHKLGEWNHLLIRVIGKRIETVLNGEAFVDYKGDTLPARGKIGLQLHAGVHQKMRFRNMVYNRIDHQVASYLTYENRPVGTAARPLVFRTYLPNPGLDEAVTSRHGNGAKTPKYSAKTGLLSISKDDNPIKGIPAAIGVSAGPTLSYVWDTTECRLLYAWANGFLDMEPYWGVPDRGSRKSRDYVPRLVGHLFYKAKGEHPLRVNGQPLSEQLRYTGHRRIEGYPVFSFETGGRTLSLSITPGSSDQTVALHYSSSVKEDALTYVDPKTPFEITDEGPGKLSIIVRPNSAETHNGYKAEVIEITEASAEVGEKLYHNFGCMACHSIDGSRNHGPSFMGLAGLKRQFPGIGEVIADKAYLSESITQPLAKSVPEFPVGMMPAYPLNEKQVDSLVLYIQSIK